MIIGFVKRSARNPNAALVRLHSGPLTVKIILRGKNVALLSDSVLTDRARGAVQLRLSSIMSDIIAVAKAKDYVPCMEASDVPHLPEQIPLGIIQEGEDPVALSQSLW